MVWNLRRSGGVRVDQPGGEQSFERGHVARFDGGRHFRSAA
jgi:hypothetical protein